MEAVPSGSPGNVPPSGSDGSGADSQGKAMGVSPVVAIDAETARELRDVGMEHFWRLAGLGP